MPRKKTPTRPILNQLVRALTDHGYGMKPEEVMAILENISEDDLHRLSYNMYRTGEKLGYDAFWDGEPV